MPPIASARLEDRVALARAALLQVVGGADAGEAGADDQDVEMLDGFPVRSQAGVILSCWLVSQAGRADLTQRRARQPAG